MEYVKGAFVGHIPCIHCGSTNNVALYFKEIEDQDVYDAYCWGCNHSYFQDELINEGMLSDNFKIDKEKLNSPKTALTKSEVENFKEDKTFDTYMKNSNKIYRGIRAETAKFYGHLFEYNENGYLVATYYPETKDNKIVGYKSRHMPKRFGCNNQGVTGISNQLSGQARHKEGGKYVLIVGGEEDKLAAAQMLRDYQLSKKQDDYKPYAVVSPTTGEGSAAKQIAAQYDWLDQFENILICMDNDKAGKEAIENICKVLPADKVSVVHLSGKDPSAMLTNGQQRQFLSDFFNAKPLINAGIKTSTESVDGMVEFLSAPKIEFPPYMHRLNDATRGGIKSTGAIINIIGETSIGKTYLSDNLIYHWIFNSPIKPTIISLERVAAEVSIDLLSLHSKFNFQYEKDFQKVIDKLKEPYMIAKQNELVINEYGEPRFFIIDERDGSVETLKRQVDRSVKQYGSRLIIFDPLTDWLRSLGNEEQEKFMMWQKLKKKEGIIFINVLHTRKAPVDKEGSFRKVTEYDALGSSTFVQSADINIVVNRDKMSEDVLIRNTTILDMPKCRGGDTGHICDLIYDKETRQQYDLIDYLENNYKDNQINNIDENVVNNVLNETYLNNNVDVKDEPF